MHSEVLERPGRWQPAFPRAATADGLAFIGGCDVFAVGRLCGESHVGDRGRGLPRATASQRRLLH
eukprot:9000286-Pyramimonas_sp.AAC.1